jgi:hypothetical protein
MYLFAGRDQLEEATATFERGVPRTAEQRRLAGHSGPSRAGGDPLAVTRGAAGCCSADCWKVR